MAQAQVTSIVKDAQLEAARVPPQSIEAEQSVLGGLLLDNSAWDRVADLLTEQDFYRADHRLIFQHIGALIEHGKPADTLTVAESLERSGKLGEIGGHAYLASLSLNTPSAANIRRYAEIVRERSVMRHLAAVGTEIADSAYSPTGKTAGELLDHAEGRVFEIAEASSRGKQGFLGIDELAARVVTRMDELYHSENPSDITGHPDRIHRPRPEDRGPAARRSHHRRRAAEHGQDRARAEHRRARRHRLRTAGRRLQHGNERGAGGDADAGLDRAREPAQDPHRPRGGERLVERDRRPGQAAERQHLRRRERGAEPARAARAGAPALPPVRQAGADRRRLPAAHVGVPRPTARTAPPSSPRSRARSRRWRRSCTSRSSRSRS